MLRGVRFAVYVSATITIAIFHNGGNGYISGILFTTIAKKRQAQFLVVLFCVTPLTG